MAYKCTTPSTTVSLLSLGPIRQKRRHISASHHQLVMTPVFSCVLFGSVSNASLLCLLALMTGGLLYSYLSNTAVLSVTVQAHNALPCEPRLISATNCAHGIVSSEKRSVVTRVLRLGNTFVAKSDRIGKYTCVL